MSNFLGFERQIVIQQLIKRNRYRTFTLLYSNDSCYFNFVLQKIYLYILLQLFWVVLSINTQKN
jgi:hypothetical protein